jgi:hypothetical protein
MKFNLGFYISPKYETTEHRKIEPETKTHILYDSIACSRASCKHVFVCVCVVCICVCVLLSIKENGVTRTKVTNQK